MSKTLNLKNKSFGETLLYIPIVILLTMVMIPVICIVLICLLIYALIAGVIDWLSSENMKLSTCVTWRLHTTFNDQEEPWPKD